MPAAISVIIPVYQVEDYLAQCLDSVIKQSFSDIEIVIVEDKGDDDSLAIAQRYAEKDSRIKIIANEKNIGIAATRNVGLQNATAEFIMFLDSDDYYDETMCEQLHRSVLDYGAGLAVCGVHVFNENDYHQRDVEPAYFKLSAQGLQEMSHSLRQKLNVVLWNKIFRRSIIERYEIRFPDGLVYEDAYFVNAYCSCVDHIYLLDEPLYHYRRRQKSIMSKSFENEGGLAMQHIDIALRFHQFLQHRGFWERDKDYACYYLFKCMDFSLRRTREVNRKREIYALVQDYMNQLEWNPKLFSTESRELFLCLQLHACGLMSTPCLGGMLTRETKLRKIKFCFLGIPLLSILIKRGALRFRLFNLIPIYAKSLFKANCQSCL